MLPTAQLLWSRTAGARFVGRILATRLRDKFSRCVVSARHSYTSSRSDREAEKTRDNSRNLSSTYSFYCCRFLDRRHIRLSSELVTTLSSCSTPLSPTGATMPNSARWARIALRLPEP
jgi:hypothetical protein